MEFESHFDWHAPLPRPGWESTWRTQAGTGGGVVYDLGSHLIDQALQLFGMPQKVTGFQYYQREQGAKYGDAESMTILLHYVNGPLVTLKASIMNPEKEKLRFWVRGDKGAFKKVG
jgi:predicted dehydrogenase